MTRYTPKAKALAAKYYAMSPLAAGIMFALNPAGSAVAQESGSEGIEEIIVTATKRAVNIQHVPQSISAFSTAEIKRRNILDMADIAVNLPSVSLSSNRAGLNELVYRGISNGGSWRLDSQVSMYLDEMPMTASTTQLDPRLVDIERVESLPGPQGTLFGSSSQTGTLRVVTNKPRFDAFAGQVSGEYKTTEGGEDGYDINGHLNIPVSDNFAIRIVAYTNKDGGYIDNVYSTAPHSVCAAGADCEHEGWGLPSGHLNGATMDNAGLEEENFNDYEMTGGRISALWNMGDKWSLLGAFMTQDSETTGVWTSDTAIGDYKVARFSDEWRKDKWTTGTLTLEGDLGFAVLTNAFGYAERQQTYHFDNTNYEAYHTRVKGGYISAYCNYWNAYDSAYCSNYHFGDYNYYDKYDTGYNGGVYRSLQDAERISNELRLTSTTDSRFQWMVGAFYENNQDGWVDSGEIPNLASTKHWAYTQFRSCDLQDQGFEVQCPLPETNDIWYIDNYDREISQIATFGEVSFNFTEKLKVTGGARWFEYDRLTVNDQQWPPGLPVEAILLDGETAFIEEGKESDTIFKVGLSYTMNEDKMFYALASEGFRLGGANNPKAVRIGFVPATYTPDKLKNYEIGMKSQWLDNRLQLNATLFHMVYEDVQLVLDSDQTWWLTGQANGGGAQNSGIEMDVDWQATDNFRISASLYMGDAHYTDDYVTLEGITEITAGTSMPDAADEKMTLAFDYTLRDVLGGDMWIRADAYYRGPMFSANWRADEANPDSPDYVEGATHDVDSFTKTNLQIGYDSGESWTATLMVRNLTNETANTYTGTGASDYGEYWGHTGFGETHNLARPRSISLRATWRF